MVVRATEEIRASSTETTRLESVEVMHNINFLQESRVKILKIIGIERDGRCIVADLVTEQLGRRTQKRYKFDINEWEQVRKRGYVE